MRKRVLYAAFWGIVLSFLLLLYWCFIVSYGKGPINWRNASIFPVPDTVYVHDTVNIIAPTSASETLLGYDTVHLEMADKTTNLGANKGEIYAKSQGNTGENLPISGGIESAHLTNEVSKSGLKERADTVGKLRASYGQVSDSVPVLVPITQRVYKDSTCTVWVSGYNPAVDSVHVYRSVAYYPVVSDKEYEPPNIVLTVGPYMGFGNKGFNYGICVTLGVPLELKWPW